MYAERWGMDMVEDGKNMRAKDRYANTPYGVKRIRGRLGGLIDVVRKMREAFVNALEAGWENDIKAVNEVVEWAKEQVTDIVNGSLDQITTISDTYINQLVMASSANSGGDSK